MEKSKFSEQQIAYAFCKAPNSAERDSTLLPSLKRKLS
jgi:hypothetical protein